MTGRQIQIADYKCCADAKNLDWLGAERPATGGTPTNWRCRQCGHVFENSYQEVRRYLYPCSKCRAAKRRLPVEAYHAIAARREFKWLEQVVPDGTEARTNWRCSEGHLWSTTYRAIKNGASCPTCIHLARKTEDDYRAFAARGITWIGEELPKSTKEPTHWRCKNGHEWTTKYATIYLGCGCPYCKKKQRKKSVRHVEAHYRELANRRGFSWIGDTLPDNSKQPTCWQCAAGHKWKASYGDLYKGYGCPYCSGVARKREVDYHMLAAERHIQWTADCPPKTATMPTTWCCSEGHTFQASYECIKERLCACPECREVMRVALEMHT